MYPCVIIRCTCVMLIKIQVKETLKLGQGHDRVTSGCLTCLLQDDCMCIDKIWYGYFMYESYTIKNIYMKLNEVNGPWK